MQPRPLAWLLVAFATLVLAAAFAGICLHARTWWPWLVVVHEDGMHTLLGTIFYFEHATRELPLDLLLGVAIGGAVYCVYPPPDEAQAKPSRAGPLGLVTVLLVLGILAGALFDVGGRGVAENLLQHHTRSGAPLIWGSHWRYHLLERPMLMLIVVGLAALLCVVTGRGIDSRGRPGLAVAAMALVVYVVVTAIFAQDLSAMALPFRDPQHLGHEARELMTHALVTIPVGIGGCILLLGLADAVAGPGTIDPDGHSNGLALLALAGGAIGLGIGGYACVAALRTNAIAHGQSTDLATLVFPHFFEHTLTYLVVPFSAAFTYALIRARQARGR